MTARNQHNGFQSATSVQPTFGGHAYVFGNGSETECSEEDVESYELRSRARDRMRRSTSRDRLDDIVYLVKDIKDGDTLNSISLQYFCSVSLFIDEECVIIQQYSLIVLQIGVIIVLGFTLYTMLPKDKLLIRRRKKLVTLISTAVKGHVLL